MNYDSKRWFYLVACMAINICIGVFYAWSVFQRPLVSHFGWDGKDVLLAFTIVMGVGSVMPLVAGKLQEYMAPRWVIFIGGIALAFAVGGSGFVSSLTGLYLVCGVFGGIGNGLIYGGTMSNIVKFFPDKSGLASGLLAGGYGAGAVIWAPLASFLIDGYGILTTFKILGVVFLVIACGLATLVKTAPAGYRPAGWEPAAKTGQVAGGSRDKNWKEMLCDPQFYILALIFIIGAMSGLMILGQASPLAQDVLKISPQDASVVVGYLALAMVAGKIFWAAISDKIGRYPVFIAVFVFSVAALAGLATFKSYLPFVLAISTVGLCYGGFLSLMPPVTADSFGAKHLGINFGIMFLTIGVAAYIGPRLAAVAKEANNGDYTQAFVIAGALSIVGIGLVLLAAYRQKKETTAVMPLTVQEES
ncbi:MAG: yhjX 2 [Firmicutes bacterium]|nr:yhjX 2 [Bacillota bacterium]